MKARDKASDPTPRDISATQPDINPSLVRQLITAQFPEWAQLPIEPEWHWVSLEEKPDSFSTKCSQSMSTSKIRQIHWLGEAFSRLPSAPLLAISRGSDKVNFGSPKNLMLMNPESEVIGNASATESRRLKERHRRVLDYVTAAILCAMVATALFVVLAPKEVRVRDRPAETTRYEIVDDPTSAWARTFLTAVGGAAIAFLSKSTGTQRDSKGKVEE